jgi:hypothetical protein
MHARARKIAFRAGATAAGILLLVGILHTPAGQPLLARLSGGGGGGCPVGLANATPEKLEEARVAGLKSVPRGEARAPVRPALRFTLAATKRATVEAWVKANHLACNEEVAGTALRCLDVDARLAGSADSPRIADLFFRFDPNGGLVALDAMYAGTSADEAARAFASAGQRLTRDLGSAGVVNGESSATYLASVALAQTSLEYRFADYAVDVTATNFGERGVIVREQYRALGE